MKELIQKLKTLVPIAVGIISVDGYRRALTSENSTSRLTKAAESLETTNKKFETLRSEVLQKQENIDILDVKEIACQNRIDNLISSYRKAWARYKEYKESDLSSESNKGIVDSILQELANLTESLSVELEELVITKARKSVELEDILKNISDSTSINKLFENSLVNINSMFSDLSTAQLGALGHIFMGIGLYYCVINIASAYYGDKLIIYFKLETKYPKLARWIRYRRVYQNYNIAFNLILILGLAGYIVFVNISVFNYL